MKDLIVNPLLQKIVKEICDQKNIDDYEILSVQGNAKGEGFLSDINFIALKYNNTQELHNFVIKVALAENYIRSIFPIRNCFINEIHFYNKVWPQLDKLQIDQNVSKKFDCVSNCLASSSDAEIEYLALDNLKNDGFEVFPKANFFDAQHLELICKEYGRLHALSFAYRALYGPEVVEKLGDAFLNVFDPIFLNDFSKKGFADLYTLAGEALIPGVDDELIKKYEKYPKNGFDLLRKAADYRGKNGIFIHGDCWSNNLMFKYDEARKVTNLKLIDFQLMRLSTPVYDLSYCLYSGGSSEFYDNFDKYLHIYHNSYTAFMKELNSDPDVFTFEDLKSEWKEYSNYGFLIALQLVKIKLTKAEDIYDLKDLKDLTDSENVPTIDDVVFDRETFLRKARELIVHRDEIGCL